MTGRKVLLLGSGGREHALAEALLGSPSVSEVVVLPGNAGTAQASDRHAGKCLRNARGGALDVARAERPALVVVGPEAPLTQGIVDELTREGFLAYGPSAKAAELEGSKVFMKDFAKRHGLRTARHVSLTSAAEVEGRVAEFALPPVVKADGLCAGKGVIVAASHAEAAAAARAMLEAGQFGEAGRRVVLEERLEGAEASVHAVCDGERAFLLPAAQDHKRIGDGDTGPNTGGMGTYAPAPLVTTRLREEIRIEIVERALAGMRAEGRPFRGTLFAGLMITPRGEPYLLEFNVRFGDPETQVLMNVLDGDIAELLASAARGSLDPRAVRVSEDHAVCVVLAAPGYPAEPRLGAEISGLDAAGRLPGVTVYHAGTRRDGERVLTAGGRVLGVTARGPSLAEAHARAYQAADLVGFDGKQFRRDIAARALGR